ncbi:penicillin-binding protein activator [Sphingomonas sp. CGMCC 1.13654]|uniref:Penicillin-binding protein activator n=1 Tax=Sphingomonas chungangi TaxID=2683589 RepID=A0A838LF47_9SPHN|nr:penicillin-binding protein activator [Sphingomonas chungangi]MBA2936058.1 penicillin-binding protein activator [Sphingomonas chungangi]MVW55447.1 ABC transporter substrate-binding protein [Sphingomonas chungangi]
MAEALVKPQPAMRATMKRAVSLLLAALLAGCSTMVPKGPQQAPPPPTKQPGTTQPGRLPEDQRDRVAVLVPLSGPEAGIGQSIANAANMALIDSGGQGVRLTMYDTATGAAMAAQKALSEGNKLILGPLLSDDVRAIAPIAAAQHVPVVAFSNDVSVAGSGIYLLGFTPTESVDRIVSYAKERGLGRLAALVPNGVYGRRASNAMLRAAENTGATVVSMQSFDRSPASLTTAIKRLGDPKGYDALLIADNGRIALAAAPLVRKSGSAAKLLGTELWNTEPQLAASKVMSGAWFAAVSDGLYSQFAGKYRARFGKGPYRLSSLGYDSVLLAVRISADWRPGTDFPLDRLADKGGFSGVDGAFRFDRDGIAERVLEVKQIGMGGVTVVSPAPQGFGDQ